MPKNNKEENKQTTSISKNYFNEDSIFTLILLILIINKLQNKNLVSGDLKDDEYMVTMGENPAFPLEDNEKTGTRTVKTILNLENQKELFTMVDILKPHMSSNNRQIINVLEKWLLLLKDLQQLTTSMHLKDSTISDIEGEQPKSLIRFLYDIKPFIHPDYHNQIEEFSQGINAVLDIQNNIYNLQYALNQTRDSSDGLIKLNTIINALHPFMGESQRKNLDKFKQLSSLMEMINISEDISSTQNKPNITPDSEVTQQKEHKSELMEILDVFDRPTKDISQEEKHSIQEQQESIEELELEDKAILDKEESIPERYMEKEEEV